MSPSGETTETTCASPRGQNTTKIPAVACANCLPPRIIRHPTWVPGPGKTGPLLRPRFRHPMAFFLAREPSLARRTRIKINPQIAISVIANKCIRSILIVSETGFSVVSSKRYAFIHPAGAFPTSTSQLHSAPNSAWTVEMPPQTVDHYNATDQRNAVNRFRNPGPPPQTKCFLTELSLYRKLLQPTFRRLACPRSLMAELTENARTAQPTHQPRALRPPSVHSQAPR